MKKEFLTVICAILSFNAFATVHKHVKPFLDFDKDYQMPHKSVSNQYLFVKIEDYRFRPKDQRVVFEEALSLLEEVMNSEEFKLKVLAYKNSSGKREYQKNYLWKDPSQRLTNEDVYNILMEGKEHMIPGTIGEMNIYAKLRICRGWRRHVTVWCRNVIGSTAPYSSEWMTLNWKFYSSFKAHEMVSNIVHEWIHLLGFLHGKVNMREEVPYVVGAIAGQVAEGIMKRRSGYAALKKENFNM